ncbi:DUF2513 domain-containing protein [Actibacterium sp. D379-3]
MKRDPQLVRDILIEYENSPLNHFKERLAVSGLLEKGIETDRGQINHVRAEHIRWMIDDGFLGPVPGAESYVRVTAKGCDFLEAVRNEDIWAQTKQKATAVGGVTLQFLGEVAKSFIRAKLQESGVPLA